MMLREMQAFQACWIDLKDDYPTSREDNTLIAQAMGQLVDRYHKPEEIENSLPEYLQPLFRRLAVAYFQGYEPKNSRFGRSGRYRGRCRKPAGRSTAGNCCRRKHHAVAGPTGSPRKSTSPASWGADF